MSHMSPFVCHKLWWKAARSTRSVEPDALWSILASPIHVFARAHSRLLKEKKDAGEFSMMILQQEGVTYTMKSGVAIDLDAGEEEATVEEDPVAFPPAWIVVRLGVHRPRHGPDSSSSHFISSCSFKN